MRLLLVLVGLVGLFAYLYRERREQGLNLMAHGPTLERDLLFFLAFLAAAGLLAWGPPAAVRVPIGIAFLAAYVLYVRSTLRGGGDVQGEETLDPLLFDRRLERRSDPALGLCVLQGPGGVLDPRRGQPDKCAIQ
jgi:Ca2+/Na+ antiporter